MGMPVTAVTSLVNDRDKKDAGWGLIHLPTTHFYTKYFTLYYVFLCYACRAMYPH